MQFQLIKKVNAMFEDSNAWANRLFDGIEVSDSKLKNRLIKTV